MTITPIKWMRVKRNILFVSSIPALDAEKRCYGLTELINPKQALFNDRIEVLGNNGNYIFDFENEVDTFCELLNFF